MKRIGIQEIARLAKVSIGTVDRALHGRKEISDATRQRILKVAAEHGYRPNLAARALSVGKPAITIGVCIPREVHYFYDELRDGFTNEARRYGDLGVEIVYRPFERLGVGEVEKMQEVLNANPQVVALCPGEPQNLAPLIDHAEKENIRVLCVASDAPGTARSTVICVDPVVNGHLAAELMSKFLSPKSDVAIITGMSATEDHRKKVQAFSEMYRCYSPGGQVLEVVEGHDQEDETFQKVFALLDRHRTLAGLYVSTANCLPVCHAIGARSLHGKVKMITTDLFKEMVPYFEKGTILASIHQRAYVQGQVAVRLTVDYLANGRPLPSTYYLTPHIVMRSNLHIFREIRHAAISGR
ncbi:MAG TPA: LacI family DNA-binding transcriptional regulator [Terriglobia bacterium]|nr:LacI family DNA-binding transcriptional regulator [Terriglobia bacterium]